MNPVPGKGRSERVGAVNSFVVFALLIMLMAVVQLAHAYQPYGYQGQPGMYPQQQPYWYPYQQPQPQPQPQYFKPPRVETSVSDPAPYEQQSLIYSIRIVSSGNLKTAVPELPQTASVVLRALGDPVTRSDDTGGSREIVTEYRYLLMPLSSGRIEIPPARVTGSHAATGGGEGPSFEASGKPVIMQVRPAAESSVQPWLPLYDLRIEARFRGEESPAAGNPIKLEVETRAVGTTGSQIPSVAGQLNSEAFRIYPGKSFTEGRISADGRTLLGHRVETFTLVPQYGGWLKLPTVTINWWNVRYNRPEVAALLTDQVNVAGPANPGRRGPGDGTSAPLNSPILWLPLVAAALILIYGWVSALFGQGRLPGAEQLSGFFKPILGELYAPLVAFANRVSPRRSFHRLRTWTGRKLPVSWKLWFCLRAVAREGDPAEWGQALQILSAKHLGVRPQAHLRHLGKSIAKFHPKADADKVDRLMIELDETIYGSRQDKSFARWKREFEHQIKPSLIPVRLRGSQAGSGSSRELPALNPQ